MVTVFYFTMYIEAAISAPPGTKGSVVKNHNFPDI